MAASPLCLARFASIDVLPEDGKLYKMLQFSKIYTSLYDVNNHPVKC